MCFIYRFVWFLHLFLCCRVCSKITLHRRFNLTKNELPLPCSTPHFRSCTLTPRKRNTDLDSITPKCWSTGQTKTPYMFKLSRPQLNFTFPKKKPLPHFTIGCDQNQISLQLYNPKYGFNNNTNPIQHQILIRANALTASKF